MNKLIFNINNEIHSKVPRSLIREINFRSRTYVLWQIYSGLIFSGWSKIYTGDFG